MIYMKFTYKKTAETAARKSRLRCLVTILIAVLIWAVGVLMMIKIAEWGIFGGILVLVIGAFVALFAIVRIMQIGNLLKAVRLSSLEITEEGVRGKCFLIKGGICLPTEAEMKFEDIKSVKPHIPNERSFDYATVEVRTHEEAYFFSVEESDTAIVEIRLHITQK